MICPKCKVEMVIGQAIQSDEHCRYIAPGQKTPITAETLEIIPCWKCPQCGHSDDGR